MVATKLSELFTQLEASLKEASEQAAEFEKGKKAAAGRLRKAAQVSKTLWQAVRVETMNVLKAMPTKTRT